MAKARDPESLYQAVARPLVSQPRVANQPLKDFAISGGGADWPSDENVFLQPAQGDRTPPQFILAKSAFRVLKTPSGAWTGARRSRHRAARDRR